MSYSWGASRNVQPRGAGLPGPLDRGSTAGQAGGGGLEIRRTAAELAPMVEVWERLIALHTPNRAGRCRMCTKGGTGLPSAPWPCSVYGVAELARRRHVSERR